jgi:type I restriction-modification system DNA methylase subunit
MTFDNPMAPVPEGTNENSPTEIDNPISIRMEFTPTAETPMLKVLSSFLDALVEADHLATLYNSKQTQFFRTSKDLPTTTEALHSQFPVRQFQPGRRTIVVLRATLSTRTNLPTLRQNGIASWASSYKIKLEEDVFLTANVKDTVWFLRKNQYTSKPHLHRFLAKKIADHKFNDDEKQELQRLHSELTFDTVPPFSMYLRRRYRIDASETTCVILRTDAVAANFYEMLLRNMNDPFEISPKEMIVSPLKLARTDRFKAVECIREQNKFLNDTVSLPLVGV